jgi:cyanophycin synthetase
MRTATAGFLAGPNIHADCSGVVVSADLEGLPLGDQPIALDPAQAERVLAALRSAALAEALATAAARGRGGFAELLPRLADALLRPVSLFPAPARMLGWQNGLLFAFLPCEHRRIGGPAWDAACRAALACLGGAERWAAFQDSFGLMDGVARSLAAEPGTALLARTARRLDIPWYRLGIPGQLAQLGQGAARRFMHGTLTDASGAASGLAVRQPASAYRLLRAAGLPVPAVIEVTSPEEAAAAAERLGFPVLVAPERGEQPFRAGAPVTTPAELRLAYAAAATDGAGALVAKPAPGRSHQVLVVGGRVISVARQMRAQILGDGRHSVAALVEQLNRDPRRAPGCDNLLARVPDDAGMRGLLAAQGLTQDSIPEPGRRVLLSQGAGSAAGGTAIDVTAAIHADNRILAERAAAAFDLSLAGVELTIGDVARSWREGGGVVAGVTAQPDLRPHRLANPERELAEPILRSLLPAGGTGRIPTCGITGSMGKTTTANMLARIFQRAGRLVGRCTTSGLSIGEQMVRAGDLAGGAWALRLLVDRRIEVGVFELARGGLLNEGMIIEDVDVGAVLNVFDNHIGWQGITSRADLARIKSIVARRARHALVLNAEDPLCLEMRRQARAGRILLVAKDPAAPAIGPHLAAGGGAVTLRGGDGDGMIVLSDRGIDQDVIETRAIPATLEGAHRGKVWNAMFAVAIAHAMAVPLEPIRAGLRSFRSDLADSHGHFSVIEDYPFRLILDYGMSGEAMAELAHVVRFMPVAGRRRICLTASLRMADARIRAIGRSVAGAFDEYVCCNRDARRRPDPEELPRILREGVLEGGAPSEAIRSFVGEMDALRHILGTSGPDDLVVVNTAEPELVLALLQEMFPGARAQA